MDYLKGAYFFDPIAEELFPWDATENA